MARKTLKDMTAEECINAYRLNREQGEGCAMISGWGSFCSYKTADAMINKGEKMLKEINQNLVISLENNK